MPLPSLPQTSGSFLHGTRARLPRSEGKQRAITFPLSTASSPAPLESLRAVRRHQPCFHMEQSSIARCRHIYYPPGVLNCCVGCKQPRCVVNSHYVQKQADAFNPGHQGMCPDPAGNLELAEGKGMCSTALLLGCQHPYCGEGVWSFPALTSSSSFVHHPALSLLYENL